MDPSPYGDDPLCKGGTGGSVCEDIGRTEAHEAPISREGGAGSFLRYVANMNLEELRIERHAKTDSPSRRSLP